MKKVGDKFYVNLLLQGVSGVATLVLDADDDLANEKSFLAAVDRGDKIVVNAMFTRQMSMSPRGPMTFVIDAEDVDMGESRRLDLSNVVSVVTKLNAIGDEHIRKIIGMMKDKQGKKSGLVIADGNTKVPSGEDAEKAMRQAGAAEKDLRDGRKHLVVQRGGKG